MTESRRPFIHPELLRDPESVHCTGCGVALGDSWCGECAGKAANERAASVQADRDATVRDNARLRADLKTWQDKLHEVREDYAAALARAEEVIARHVDLLATAKEAHDDPLPADNPLALPGKHCDDYIHDFTAPSCLRFFLLVQRMPAMDAMLCREFGVKPRLFATYEGERVRIVMASRMGDVGITQRLDAEDGYAKRVMVSDLTNFGDAP